jgi:tetratricopeptide (TPR) repeat protein
MSQVLRIPGRRVEDRSLADLAGPPDIDLKAGFEVELDAVIDVTQSRDGGFEDLPLAQAAPAPPPAAGARRRRRAAAAEEEPAPVALRVCQVELEGGARLWLRPESFYAMFGQGPTRGALPRASDGVWQIDPLVRAPGGTRGGVLDRIVKVASWVVKPLAGVAKGFVAGKPVYNLAKAIEDHLHGGRVPGLYSLSLTGDLKLQPCENIPAGDRPVLVFLHGTLSSTPGSFGGLWEPSQAEGAELRKALAARYGETAYALEHYTLTESPVANALALAERLPDGARLHLVSHSRGGLIGELLCLAGVRDKAAFSADAIAELLARKAEDPQTTATDEAREHWKQETTAIRTLVGLLYRKGIRVERFVRVACPSEGTTLAMRRIDVWLSLYKHFIDSSFEGMALKYFPPAIPLRALIGLVAQPDAADKLPGVWAMTPGNPLVSLINFPALRVDADLTVISGNHEGRGALAGGLEALLNQFFRDENDFIVNTGAMYGGLPRDRTAARFELDKGPEVTHFRYFVNPDSVRWLKAGLLRADGDPGPFRDFEEAPRKAPHLRAVLRPVEGPRPIVFVLPGIMGSELAAAGETVWLDYPRLALGGIGKIAIDKADVEATRPLEEYYGGLIDFLSQSHEVVPFAYDWRRSIFDAAARLAEAIARRLDEQERSPTPMPVRIVAHSMGGLVVRALIAGQREVWKRMCANERARVVMLGTPSGGSHEIVRLLLGQSGTLMKLALLDFTRGTRRLLDIINAFPGVLELLPQDSGGYFSSSTWAEFARLDEVGRGTWALPDADRLASARAALDRLALGERDAQRIVYVAGCADSTPSGWIEDIEWDYERGTQRRTIAFTASPHGDGRVLWETGIPSQVARWFMPEVAHGDLCNAPEYFPALLDLIDAGHTDRLPRTPPPRRSAGAETLPPIRRDAPSEQPSMRGGRLGSSGVLDDLLGRGRRRPARKPLPDRTRVRVVHGDLAYARFPVVVGHYAGDTLVGAEAVLDRALDGALQRRSQLGLYAGAPDTVTVELQDDARKRPAGAVVIGLGRPDELSPGSLRQGMTRAALEYALCRLPPAPREAAEGPTEPLGAKLSCLLVGTGAGGVSVRNGVLALLGGIAAANRRLAEHDLAGRVWIDEVEFIELWLDRAAQAAAAVELALRDGELAGLFCLDGEPAPDGRVHAVITPGEGGLRRIEFEEAPNWWQRLEIGFDKRLRQLRFVVMGERARAEEMLVAGQIETAERFIDESIGSASRNAEVSRTLFEMLVPNRLKETAPDEQNVWLLLDEFSGAFPWELLEDRWSRDGRPLAVAAGMLRQFKTIEFRQRPAMAIADAALVIGDPALPRRRDFPFLDLPGAQREAQEVAALLESHGFEAVRDVRGGPSRIFKRLHARDWRILHLAGHGVHEWKVKRLRPPPDAPCGAPVEVEESISGMLIGDMVFLTPGDVEQMRFVPELVFLNCCHLGRLAPDARQEPWRLGNKLAANLAAQFIRMGVRAVVAAGWAVDDAAALTFATSFYDSLLRGDGFGAAVKQARQITYLQHGGTNTWGAFQCYGDPNWQLRARQPTRAPRPPSPLRSPAHAVVELDNLRERMRTGDTEAELALEARLRQLKEDHPNWLDEARVATAAGLALGEAERFEEAIRYLTLAAKSRKAEISLLAIEQRANLTVKKALRDALAESADQTRIDGALEGINGAIADLQALCRFGETPERLNLLGSAFKRLAWINSDHERRRQALAEGLAAYIKAHELRNAGVEMRDAYPVTNLLSIWAVMRWLGLNPEPLKREPTELIAAALQWAERQEARNPDFWSTVATADCRLTEAMLQERVDDGTSRAICDHYRLAIVRGTSPKSVGAVREHVAFALHMARLATKRSHIAALQRVRQVLF